MRTGNHKHTPAKLNEHACKWARALNFGEFSDSDSNKEAYINYRFNIFVYEGHDPWHTQ